MDFIAASTSSISDLICSPSSWYHASGNANKVAHTNPPVPTTAHCHPSVNTLDWSGTATHAIWSSSTRAAPTGTKAVVLSNMCWHFSESSLPR